MSDLDAFGNRLPQVKEVPTPSWRLRGKMAPKHLRWENQAREALLPMPGEDPKRTPSDKEIADVILVLYSCGGRAHRDKIADRLRWTRERTRIVLGCAARRKTSPRVRSLYDGHWMLE